MMNWCHFVLSHTGMHYSSVFVKKAIFRGYTAVKKLNCITLQPVYI